jgi:hypothetical protein
MAKIDRLGKRPERFRCAEMRKLSFIKMPLPLNYVVLRKRGVLGGAVIGKIAAGIDKTRGGNLP